MNAAANEPASNELTLAVGARTDPGQVRPNNEDAVRVWSELPATVPFAERGYLFAVADGVGGNEGGEIASALAVERLFHAYYSGDTDNTEEALKVAFNAANLAVYEAGESQPSDRQMGTTLVAGVIRGSLLTVGNVGDSRAYIFRGRSNAMQISKDHSMVAEAVRAGQMTEEQARTSRQRNIVTRALGQRQRVETDIFEVDLMPSDVILLCSDGLSGVVDEAEMKRMAQELPPGEAADELIAAANSLGASDNVSAVVVKVTREGQPALTPLPASMIGGADTTTTRLPTAVPIAARGPNIAAIVAVILVLALIIAAVLLFSFGFIRF